MSAVLTNEIVFTERDYSKITGYWMIVSQQEGADQITTVMANRARGLLTRSEWRAGLEDIVARMVPGPVTDLFAKYIASYQDPYEKVEVTV